MNTDRRICAFAATRAANTAHLIQRNDTIRGNAMKKRFRIALLSAAAVLLIVLICVIGTHLYRQAYRYSGTIVSWSPENHPYEIHDLSSGTSERLSAETYSKKYRDTGYALDCSDGSMTVAVWTNGTQLLRFSSDLYTESAPVLLGDCVYFAAAETAEIGAAYYLWEYDDGQIRSAWKRRFTAIRRWCSPRHSCCSVHPRRIRSLSMMLLQEQRIT